MICLYHGGKEQYRYPSPNLQIICRKVVEKGADLVICQHSHCIGCEEKWNGGTIIVYGQGNFLFDYSTSEFWETGVLVTVDIDEQFKVNYVTIVKEPNDVDLAYGNDRTHILDLFYKRTSNILKDNFIE